MRISNCCVSCLNVFLSVCLSVCLSLFLSFSSSWYKFITETQNNPEQCKENFFFCQISRCAKSPQFQATSNEQEESTLSGLKQWQGVAASSEDEPHVVVEFLLSVQQFDLATEWAELHDLPSHFHKVRDTVGEICEDGFG